MFVVLIIHMDLSCKLCVFGTKKHSGFFKQKNQLIFVEFNVGQNTLTVLINFRRLDIIIMGLWEAYLEVIF